MDSVFKSLIRPYRTLIVGSIAAQMLFSLMGLASPWMLKIAIDRILPNSDYELFYILAGAMIFIYTLRCIMRYISGYMGTYTVARILLDVRSKLFKHLQSLSLRFYDEYRTGKLISNVISDVGLLQQLVAIMIAMSDQIFTALIVLVMLFCINWFLAIIVLLFLPIHLLNFLFFKKILRQDSLNLQERMSNVSAHLSENINGIKVIKSFSKERRVRRSFFGTLRPVIDLQLQLNINSSKCFSICDVLTVTTYLCLIGFGIGMVKKGELTYGDFAAFYAYVGILIAPINALSNQITMISQGLAGMARVSRLLSVIPEIKEPEKPICTDDLIGDIKFENVSFKYKDTPVLKNFNLHIKQGEKVALVGPSGCGKSTASNLIMRFYDATEGVVLVDDKNIRDYSLESYHSHIGVVLQEPFLFSGTIRDNIAYAKKDASKEEVENAARLANVEEFVKTLPHGYDSIIGENGASLSGGQKQRLAIARAILKNPTILILDEATSALDTVSERLVQDALDNVMRGRTTIIIAHRLSTIKNADKIVVLRKGEIMQCGNHDELVSCEGIYQDMYTTQAKQSQEDAS